MTLFDISQMNLKPSTRPLGKLQMVWGQSEICNVSGQDFYSTRPGRDGIVGPCMVWGQQLTSFGLKTSRYLRGAPSDLLWSQKRHIIHMGPQQTSMVNKGYIIHRGLQLTFYMFRWTQTELASQCHIVCLQ